jgi:hypothetical protein
MTMHCDVCNSNFDPVVGYILSNRQVATSERYWEHALRSDQKLSGWLMLDEGQTLAAFSERLRMRAADRSAWAVCENCSEYFLFDRVEARAHAIEGTRPRRKENKLNVSEFALFAALGFERVHGHWPATVERIPPKGSCNFCGKRVYGPETVAMMKADAVARLRAEGLLEAPVGEPESFGGEERWALCKPCMALMDAKEARKNREPRQDRG